VISTVPKFADTAPLACRILGGEITGRVELSG